MSGLNKIIAVNVKYDNTASGLTSNEVQGAIDELSNGVIGDFTQKSSRNIGEIVQSTIPLTDAGLHLLDGGLILAGGSYNAFYLHMKDLYDGGLNANLFTTEANWQASVSAYGVCGKFVFTDGVSVRLPKITGFIEGTITITDLGNLTEAGLPNITGKITNSIYGNEFSGAIYSINTSNASFDGNGFYGGDRYFDASLSNAIYGNSTTVQPQSIKVLYYIVVATSVKTDIVVDIDQITVDLAGKVDIDGSNAIFDNLNNTAKENITNLFSPDLTAGVSVSSGSYTPTSNGWFKLSLTGANSNGTITDTSTSILLGEVTGGASQWYSTTFLIPAQKSKEYTVVKSGTNVSITFFPNLSSN